MRLRAMVSRFPVMQDAQDACGVQWVYLHDPFRPRRRAHPAAGNGRPHPPLLGLLQLLGQHLTARRHPLRCLHRTEEFPNPIPFVVNFEIPVDELDGAGDGFREKHASTPPYCTPSPQASSSVLQPERNRASPSVLSKRHRHDPPSPPPLGPQLRCSAARFKTNSSWFR